MLVLIIVFFIGISLLSIGLCIHFFASKYEVNYFGLYMDKSSELITAEEHIESLELQLREQDKLIDKYNKQIAKLKEEIKVLKRELKK